MLNPKRDNTFMSKKKKNILSLFSSCGGLDLGFIGEFETLKASINDEMHSSWIDSETRSGWVRLRKNNYRIVFANDIKKSTRILWTSHFKKYNINPKIYHEGSIVDYVKTHRNGEKVFPDNVDIVTGGFPCQDFIITTSIYCQKYIWTLSPPFMAEA